MRKMLTAAFGVIVLAGSLGLFWYWNTRATLVVVDAALPANFPTSGFAHDSFEALLRRHVKQGRVDYAGWHDDASSLVALDSYLAAIASFSPDSAPERFASKEDRLAYWMYAYNAFVIKAILERWPLASVTDVKAPVEVVQGLGFFYTLKFVAGGKRYTLYDLEHDEVMKKGDDPRIHFVLNCGSSGCPVMRPELPTGAALEPFLEQAARDFVAEPRNVHIDHDAKVIHLSKIFEWYQSDFVSEVRRRGRPTTRGLVSYVELVAPESLRSELAGTDGYEVRFHDYDWSVNEAKP